MLAINGRSCWVQVDYEYNAKALSLPAGTGATGVGQPASTTNPSPAAPPGLPPLTGVCLGVPMDGGVTGVQVGALRAAVTENGGGWHELRYALGELLSGADWGVPFCDGSFCRVRKSYGASSDQVWWWSAMLYALFSSHFTN